MGDAQNYMKRAIALAARAEGRTAPNPLVGCVLVKKDAIIGEGWHEGPGLDHAEVAALKNAGDAARGATAYVTLEPCNHKGRTGPCTEALIDAGIDEVIYATADPNPEAAGGGARLKDAGIKIAHGVCEKEARDVNRFWLQKLKTGRPFVSAKFAASLDGKIATASGDSKWITGPNARARAHDLRRQVDAILVGADTVIADDPSLTARRDAGETQYPLRVVLDSTARTSPGAKVYDRAGKGAMLATTHAAPESRLAAFREHGVEIVRLEADRKGRPDLDALMANLSARDLNGLMVEGGGALLGSFFDANLVDEVWAFIAPAIIGGAGKSPVAGSGAATIADALLLEDTQMQDALPRHFDARARQKGRRPVMFTGLIEEMGSVAAIRQTAKSFDLTLSAKVVLDGVKLGDSIAVNGVCLTVTAFDENTFTVGLAPETLARTNLSDLATDDPVNLERSLLPTTRLGGHFVQGHIDATGVIKSFRPDNDALWLTIDTDPSLMRYIVTKGYVAIDGTSLTVVDTGPDWFNVTLINYSQGKIILPGKKPGDRVNLEVDILAKYLERLRAAKSADARPDLTPEFLHSHGFLKEGAR